MIKRITAILFILLANISLLAHTVIAHHYHHKSEVCIADSHHQKDTHFHQYNTAQHYHEYHGKSDHEHCALKQVAVLPVKYKKQEIKCSDCANNQIHSCSFQAALSNSNSINLQQLWIVINSQNYTPSFYTQLVSSNLGLRAPPII